MNDKFYEQLNSFEERLYVKRLREGTVMPKIHEIERLHIYLTQRKESTPTTVFTATKEDAKEYVKVLEIGVNNETYNLRLRMLQEFYEYLKEKEILLLNPFKAIYCKKIVKKKQSGIFSEDEIKKIFAIIPHTTNGIRDRALFELMYSSALRAGELLNLEVNDIDFRNREVFVRDTKTKRERIALAGEEALKRVKQYITIRSRFLKENAHSEILFLSKNGHKLKTDNVRHTLNVYRRLAGVENKGASLHAFRHSAASHMLRNGASIEAVQRLLGHERLSSTQIYTHIANDDLKTVHAESHPRSTRRS